LQNCCCCRYLNCMSEDAEPEPLIAFLDANIILEGKSLSDLPWEEVGLEGTILALIVPKAMEEIDAKKRDGRLGSHARAFNRLIGQSVVSGNPVVLRETSPRVELQMASCSRIAWENYDELDPDDGDSRIVAEALNVRDVDSSRRILISHDIKPLAYAKGRGLAIYQVSDNWLRPIEPSPKDKQIQRLKQEVRDLRQDEPTFDILIELPNSSPATLSSVLPLSTEQAEGLSSVIISNNPRVIQNRNRFSSILDEYDGTYNRKYDKYINNAIPNFTSIIHNIFQTMINQIPISVRITNNSPIRADNIAVSISVNDGWINENIIIASVNGPSAPVPKRHWERLSDIPTLERFAPIRVGRHEFEITKPARRTRAMEASCEDFRSGQEFLFSGVVVPSTHERDLEITVSITASNLRGKRIEISRVRKQITEVYTSDILDLKNLTVNREFPIKSEIQRLVNSRQIDDIEWDNGTESV
jgi:hypothetical protein